MSSELRWHLRCSRGLRRLLLLGFAVAPVAVVGCGDESAPPNADGGTGKGAKAGLQATRAPWEPEYRFLVDRLAAVGVPPVGDESFHIHALVSVYIDGRKVPVPANIGIGITARGPVESPLHTHDDSGVIHVEADDEFPFTLGHLFDVWGVKLTPRQIGAYVGQGDRRLRVYVDGRPVRDPVRHVLADGQNIVVAYGAPQSFPTRPDASALDDS